MCTHILAHRIYISEECLLYSNVGKDEQKISRGLIIIFQIAKKKFNLYKKAYLTGYIKLKYNNSKYLAGCLLPDVYLLI